jgi:tellurite resistance protein TehA-like permease
MDKNDLLKKILLNVLYVIILIAAVTLVSAIVASIGANITHDINVIVIACLVSIWITILALNILKCFIFYRKKTKELNKNDVEEYKKGTKKFKNKSIITVSISSIFIGLVLYNLKNELVNSIESGTQKNTNVFSLPTFYIKISITVILIIILILKQIMKKKKEKTREENSKGSPNVV